MGTNAPRGFDDRYERGKSIFRALAEKTADLVGSSTAFFASVALVMVWFVSGFAFRFSDAWQLIINTATNILTFFIVFLIQNSQNRDTRAIHLKLDELIRAVKDARTHLVGLENLSDEDLARLDEQFQGIRMREIRKLEQQPAAKDQEKAGGG